MIDLLIQKLERYRPLSDEEKAFLQRAPWHVREYDPQEAIVHEGDCPSESCLMVEGFACRFKLLRNGRRQILAFHIPGDFCDLHSFSLKRMDHGISAVTKCAVAKVSHGTIREITERYPGLTRALLWDVAMDAAVFREWMVTLGRRSAREKVAHLLCELMVRLQSVGLSEDNSYALAPRQADLGDALGLSTVHVNRTLQELRAEGLIVSNGRRLSIPDIEKLKEAAEFNPGYLHVRGGAASDA
jgi:CRP-like cAMP-binding protein